MRKRQNEQKIYEAALKQFAKQGYKKTTLDDIAEKLNMTNANLYSYATSKQALYHDCVAYAMTKWQNYVYDTIKDITEPVHLLTTLFDSAVLYLSDSKTFLQILKNDHEIFPMFPTVDPFEEINKRSLDMLKSVLDLGVDNGVFVQMDTLMTAKVLFSVYKAIILESYVYAEDWNVLDSYCITRDLLIKGIIKR